MAVSTWTDYEVDILRAYYKYEGVKGCQDKGLNRSIKAIERKDSRLGIKVVNRCIPLEKLST